MVLLNLLVGNGLSLNFPKGRGFGEYFPFWDYFLPYILNGVLPWFSEWFGFGGSKPNWGANFSPFLGNPP